MIVCTILTPCQLVTRRHAGCSWCCCFLLLLLAAAATAAAAAAAHSGEVAHRLGAISISIHSKSAIRLHRKIAVQNHKNSLPETKSFVHQELQNGRSRCSSCLSICDLVLGGLPTSHPLVHYLTLLLLVTVKIQLFHHSTLRVDGCHCNIHN